MVLKNRLPRTELHLLPPTDLHPVGVLGQVELVGLGMRLAIGVEGLELLLEVELLGLVILVGLGEELDGLRTPCPTIPVVVADGLALLG